MRRFCGASLLVVAAFATSYPAPAAPIDDANAAVVAAQKGEYENAIKLFTNAINTDGLDLHDRAQAYAYRGIAKATTGDYDGAQEDLNSSVVLNSDFNGDAYAYRGYFRMVRGQAAEAAADLAKSAEYHIWPYNVLWLYLARQKAGVPDVEPYSLPKNAAVLSAAPGRDGTQGMTRWPSPVVNFLLGKVSETDMRKAASEGDPARLAERVCDADFYGAEFDLAHGRAAAAKPKLQAAVDKCPFASFERMGATAELDRMK